MTFGDGSKGLSAMYKNMLGILIILVLGTAGCSKTPEEQLANAQEQLAANDYPTAVITLKNLLQKDPDYADGRLFWRKRRSR